MKRRNRNLRVVMIALALVLALGATQAAVAPQLNETNGHTQRAQHRTYFHGFIAGAMKFVRLGQWLVPAPTPLPYVAPTPPPEPTFLLGAPKDPEETTHDKLIDDSTPM